MFAPEPQHTPTEENPSALPWRASVRSLEQPPCRGFRSCSLGSKALELRGVDSGLGCGLGIRVRDAGFKEKGSRIETAAARDV